MGIVDYVTITAIMCACSTVLGWWLKSRLDNSIKHEYDKILEVFKSQLKRSDILLEERLSAFKALSGKLIALRRYCNATSAEFRNESEFEPRTDSLTEQENLGLLMYKEHIDRALESVELLISPSSRKAFDNLFLQMNMGFNVELWLASGDPAPDILVNTHELYDIIAARTNDVLGQLYSDLGLPGSLKDHPAPLDDEVAPNSTGQPS